MGTVGGYPCGTENILGNILTSKTNGFMMTGLRPKMLDGSVSHANLGTSPGYLSTKISSSSGNIFACGLF